MKKGLTTKTKHFQPHRWLVFFLFAALLFGCGSAASEATPAEEEQMKNIALSYFQRGNGVPEYEATIEEVEEGWARVRISPVGVESVGGEMLVYLQEQIDQRNTAPTAEANVVAPSATVRTETETGWAVIAGPQAQFSQIELDSAGVPPFIRTE